TATTKTTMSFMNARNRLPTPRIFILGAGEKAQKTPEERFDESRLEPGERALEEYLDRREKPLADAYNGYSAEFKAEVTRIVFKIVPKFEKIPIKLWDVEIAIKTIQRDGLSWGVGKWVMDEYKLILDCTLDKDLIEKGDISCKELQRMIQDIDLIGSVDPAHMWNEHLVKRSIDCQSVETQTPRIFEITVEFKRRNTDVDYGFLVDRVMEGRVLIQGFSCARIAMARDIWGAEVLEVIGYYDDTMVTFGEIIAALSCDDVCFPLSALSSPDSP
ncbi:hypothetical protein PENTCL1PPCAC_25335, partial [Pristionchus entomophagus]